MLSRDERKKQAEAKYERRLAEDRLATAEAQQKELEARAKQRELRRREEQETANDKKAEDKRRIQEKKHRRELREEQQKEKDESKRARESYRQTHPGFYNPNLKIHSVIAVFLSLLALFIAFSFFFRGNAGFIGNALADCLLGCFSYTAFLIPIFMLVHAILWRRDVRERTLLPKLICFIPLLLLSSALAAVLAKGFDASIYDAGAAFLAGCTFTGGGAVGGAVGYVMHRAFGMVGLVLFSVIVYALFIALYCRDLLKMLYERARLAIKAAMVERAKRRQDARTARAVQKQQDKVKKKEMRLARREEQQKELAQRKKDQREEAALRREERRVALEAKKEEQLSAKKEAAALKAADTAEKTDAKPAQPKDAPLPSVRDRILLSPRPAEEKPAAKEEGRQLPEVLQEDVAARDAQATARDRRRALFADLEDDWNELPVERVATPDARQAAGKPQKKLFDFDSMPVERADTVSPAKKAGAAAAALANDPMHDKEALDLSRDELTVTKESVRPIKAVDEPTEMSEEAPQQPEAPARPSSPLGKRLWRSMTGAPAPATEETEEVDAAEETDINYFRRIATPANEQATANDDLLFTNPQIRPMPKRGAAKAADAAAEAQRAIPTDEEPITVAPATHIPPAAENPFHPQNNPGYKKEGKAPAPQYNGVQDPSLFSPAGMASKSKPVQQQMQVTAAPAKPTPPPKPPYQYPPISLLIAPDVENERNIAAEVQANAEKLVTTLDSFKVHTRVTGYTRGPRITRYEIVPDAGIRVAKISALVEDISMSLATAGIRIEAPIPGKSAVGIEVPNSNSTLVRLRSMLDSEKFRNVPDKSYVCLGGDVTGQPVYCDLAKMPHLLVAGATGMGKSVCINSIILSLLYKATPEEIKLIMIDPKMVEFNIYAGIPHLLVPVVTDPKKAAGALSWAVNEMERRYALIKQANVRNIKDYNRYVTETGDGEVLPKIIIIIDELADLMLSAKDAVETSIARLAAKARAAGIHLLIGTQRPSVDVITGTIKSNIPSRIAFHVSSQVDSRTILDSAGAEKLLTHGDMLYVAAGKEPQRVQGAFVDDKEIVRVVEFLKTHNEIDDAHGEEIMADIEREAEKCVPQKKRDDDDDFGGGGSNIPTDDDDNHLLWAALQVGFDFKKISTSLLQRKLSIGYGKAAKILDALEDQGYISAPDGSKPREILISYEEFKEMMARGVHEQTNGNF